jgi:hypothetical protein
MVKKTSSKEAVELAEEHIKIAEDLINEESKKCDPDSKKMKELSEAAFALEKAESEVEDINEAED